MTPSIAVIITDRDSKNLCDHIRTALPAVKVQQWPEIFDPNSVVFAVLWKHPEGITRQFPHLKAVTSMGAGTDHLDQDAALTELPKHRIVTESLKQMMAQYVLLFLLSDVRHQMAYDDNQRNKQWHVLEKNGVMKTVGFIGLGALGIYCADRCADLGFKVMAWTQSSLHPKYPCYHGETGLEHVISNSDCVVLLLPLTKETHHIIDANTLCWFKQDALLINVSRGGHVNEQDLFKALQGGQLKHAVLDVFEDEPLSEDSPLWSLEQVTITPHIAARSDDLQTAEAIARLYNTLC